MKDFTTVLNTTVDFEEIKDEKFHELRLAYLEAADALKKYIGDRLVF
jgi:hypothetical protein